MKYIIVGIIFIGIFSGCKHGRRANVRDLVQEVQIGRLDCDLFALDSVSPDFSGIEEKYGNYLDTYAQGVLNLCTRQDSAFPALMTLFVRDTIMREVADSVRAAYPDMRRQERELAWAWAYYAYYFPERTIPRVYAHISGFNQSVVVDSAVIGVGLDNYLGENCVFYSMLAVPVPMYVRRKMTGTDIPRDVLSGWICSEFPFRPLQNDLISGMIYQGKVVYVLEKLFPEWNRHWLFGYTKEQEEWCRENEAEIWGFLIENEYVFTTQQRLIVKYLNDAPFTSGMPSDSPGRTVVWTGFRIVEKYMKKTGASLEELMQEQDYHKILRVAGYRP